MTSDELAGRLEGLLGGEHLYFYDAIAPIVDGDSLDHSRLFWGSRYGKGRFLILGLTVLGRQWAIG